MAEEEAADCCSPEDKCDSPGFGVDLMEPLINKSADMKDPAGGVSFYCCEHGSGACQALPVYYNVY